VTLYYVKVLYKLSVCVCSYVCIYICIVQVLKLRYNEIRDAGAGALADAVKVHPTLGNKF
jgi:hypothetical protein